MDSRWEWTFFLSKGTQGLIRSFIALFPVSLFASCLNLKKLVVRLNLKVYEIVVPN